MPGLINKETRSALPLSVSDISSCVRGYTLAMTTSMTYENIEDHAIEGIFIYPLEENSIVVGFEAMISTQIITLQIKDKTKIEDCHLDCCNTSNGTLQNYFPTPPGGWYLMDEDLERTVLVVNLGIIPPMETVHILVSTSSELFTLPNGGIRVSSPPVCTPRVQSYVCTFRRDRHTSASSPHDQTPNSPQPILASLLEEETINSMDYEFNFQMEIRAPYLLAGVESPSHAIRADADPLARSATSIVVTLADKYTYDCPVTILIYPSEPHLPHVLIENGDMTQEEYDEYLHGRSDFIKATKKDSSNERKVDVIHKRLHKDILHNPVVMLNFCPDLKPISSDLRKVHGEFIFLIDRSGSMSGVNINRVKDAMVVILKSLVPGCLFNIIGFGSTFKSLFTTSQNYEEDALALACEYVRKIRADMGGTNILAPLNWILRQPMFSSHPRLLFLLTDGAVSNTGKVIELVRSHARYIRQVLCFTFGIGQNACRRLVQGLATVSRGTAEFLADGERLQPKMIKSLKKTTSPVLSDISIEWLFPETKEVLLSPVGSTFLFPGDSLIGYCVVCDTTRYHANPKSDKRRRYSMMRSTESASSVFYHSQEEDPLKTGVDSQGSYREAPSGALYDSYQDSVTENRLDSKMSPRRRAYSTNQIVDYNPAKKIYTPSDPSSVAAKNPLRRAKVQELIGQMSPEHETQWKNDYQVRTHTGNHSWRACVPHLPEGVLPAVTGQSLIRRCFCSRRPMQNFIPILSPKTLLCPVSSRQLPTLQGKTDPDPPPTAHLSAASETQLCQAETPQECQTSELGAINQHKGDCKAVVSGLLCGKSVKWEVVFDIEPYLNGREREEKVHEELWNETFHHLAGRSIINDFEHMGDKECEIEHGSGRRYQIYAVHTSKACNILSKYTAFVPIDLDTNEYLHTCIEYINTGKSYRFNVKKSYYLTRAKQLYSKEYAVRLQVRLKTLLLILLFTSATFHLLLRLALSRTRLLTRAAKGFMCRSHSKSGDSIGESDNENKDYIPLVLLQLASGAFPLDTALCDAINVPMDKLKWTSPFFSHRTSLDLYHQSAEHSSSSPSHLSKASSNSAQKRMLDPESMVWATAVALAWLEHSSASYFIEWEMVAAKASMWLGAQDIPEGKDLASVKAAANQLFIILRHWDENLQLNMLCYNPNSV
uniref:von Willebrand factor A domain containing 5B1 n=1 Tax=Sphaeramia orbicularis TaxID=375764 RepID=A0A673BS36_9TELE